MNPSERFHPSLLGFCVDKRQEGWKSCHIAGRDFSKPLSDCSILSLCGILPVWAQRYTTRFLSLHVRICVCGRSPFVPACVSIQGLLICNSGVFFFFAVYKHLLFSLFIYTPSWHVMRLSPTAFAARPSRGTEWSSCSVYQRSPWLHNWQKKDFCLAK